MGTWRSQGHGGHSGLLLGRALAASGNQSGFERPLRVPLAPLTARQHFACEVVPPQTLGTGLPSLTESHSFPILGSEMSPTGRIYSQGNS